MTVRVYRHDDSSAPALSGTAGALVALLDACLVNGYGAKTAAGWTKSFSGTNKAAYRMGAGNQRYLRVDDSGTTTARAVGYESMSDVDTGTNPFPTAAQLSGGTYMWKSQSGNGTARPWILLADEKRFYLFIVYDQTSGLSAASTYQPTFFFGDIIATKPGDAYSTLIIGNDSTSASDGRFAGIQSSSGGHNDIQGHWLARNVAETVGAHACSKASDTRGNVGSLGIGGSAYPDPATGGMVLAPVFVTDSGSGTNTTRGTLPGLWNPLHNLPASPGDTFTGAGALAGKSFILLETQNQFSRCRVAVETSDTWE